MPYKNPLDRKNHRVAHAEKFRAYEMAYYAAHREEKRAYNASRYTAKAEEKRAHASAYRAANPTETRLRVAAWRASHRKEGRAYSVAYRASHHEEVSASLAAYAAAHPEALRASQARRRAAKRHAPINDLTHTQWVEIQAGQAHRCAYCGKRAKGHLTQDHITPLSKGGSHTASNILAACQPCNSKKGAGDVLVPVQPLLLTVASPKKKAS